MASRGTASPRVSPSAHPTKSTARKSSMKRSPAPKDKVLAGKPPVTVPTNAAPKAGAPKASSNKAAPAKPETSDKPRKAKMVRDSFTMPKGEYAAIDALKARAAKAGRPAKKSELLRAGIQLLDALTPAALVARLKGLPPIKTGRPAKG